MSIIVVVRKGQQAAIAADTAESDESLLIPAAWRINHTKLLRTGGTWIGVAGWAATANIMQHVVQRHRKELDFSNREAIFATALKLHRLLKDDYFVEPREDKEQPVESSQLSLLIAGPGGLFELESWRSVTEYTRFWAIGSGTRLALGAMHAVYGRLKDPRAIARAGILAACEFDDGCLPPVEVRSLRIRARR
ncbi:MAG: MFS transporter [Gammaproteobacteria bacterium]|nr:MFS transporter [Gammaproteobacteria bacterium]